MAHKALPPFATIVSRRFTTHKVTKTPRPADSGFWLDAMMHSLALWVVCETLKAKYVKDLGQKLLPIGLPVVSDRNNTFLMFSEESNLKNPIF